MIWLVVVVVVIAVLVVLALGYDSSPRDAARYQARVDLHGIQRRQEVAQLKRDIRRDAAEARRELRAELNGLEKRRRS